MTQSPTVAVEHHSLQWLARQLRVNVELLRALEKVAADEYVSFPVVKAGKTRQIDNPRDALKLVLRRIRRMVLRPIPLPEFVHGCVRGRSAVTAAKEHVAQRNLASIDIRDFYPSVTPKMVYAVLRHRIGLGPRLAAFITRIATVNFRLPQGAPTSDALANQVVWRTDERLADISRQLDLRVSRYLDNIDLSGENTREAIGLVIGALRADGFRVRHRKTFNAGPSLAHVVTGLNVNGKGIPSAPRELRDKARATVHRLIRLDRAGQDISEIRNSARGYIAHLQQTNPGTANRLERQLSRAGISLAVPKKQR